MKDTLKAVKSILQKEISYIRDGDIYITANENIIPHHVNMPCIGIKDGDIMREFRMGCTKSEYTIYVFPYTSLASLESVVLGDEAANEKGLIDIVSDINMILDGNVLNVEGIRKAVAGRKERNIQKLEDDNGYCFRKMTMIEYEREVAS